MHNAAKAGAAVSGESCCYPLDEVGYMLKNDTNLACSPGSSNHGSLIPWEEARQRYSALRGRCAPPAVLLAEAHAEAAPETGEAPFRLLPHGVIFSGGRCPPTLSEADREARGKGKAV